MVLNKYITAKPINGDRYHLYFNGVLMFKGMSFTIKKFYNHLNTYKCYYNQVNFIGINENVSLTYPINMDIDNKEYLRLFDNIVYKKRDYYDHVKTHKYNDIFISAILNSIYDKTILYFNNKTNEYLEFTSIVRSTRSKCNTKLLLQKDNGSFLICLETGIIKEYDVIIHHYINNHIIIQDKDNMYKLINLHNNKEFKLGYNVIITSIFTNIFLVLINKNRYVIDIFNMKKVKIPSRHCLINNRAKIILYEEVKKPYILKKKLYKFEPC